MEFKRAYISGVCVLANYDGEVVGSVFNEFGVSAFEFAYNKRTSKVKLISVMASFDKWYVKRALRKSLVGMMQALGEGNETYVDAKRGIKFTLSPMLTSNDEEDETAE